MAKKYRRYRGGGGRKSTLAVVLCVIAVLAIVVFVMSRSVIFTSDGLKFEGFFGKPAPTVTPSVEPSVTPPLIINTPTPSAPTTPGGTPSPSASPDKEAPAEIKSVYLPDITDKNAVNSVIQLARSGRINTVVVNMKHDDGTLAFVSANEAAVSVGANPEEDDYSDAIAELAGENLYLVARISVFKDNLLPRKLHEYSVKTANGIIWLDQNYTGWMNPYSGDAEAYISDIAAELVGLGFGEVMLDNFCFPTKGRPQLLHFPEEETTPRGDALDSFSKAVSAAVTAAGGNLSFCFDTSDIAAGTIGSGLDFESGWVTTPSGALKQMYIMVPTTNLQQGIETASGYGEKTNAKVVAIFDAPREYTDPSAAENLEMLINTVLSTGNFDGFMVYDKSGSYPVW